MTFLVNSIAKKGRRLLIRVDQGWLMVWCFFEFHMRNNQVRGKVVLLKDLRFLEVVEHG